MKLVSIHYREIGYIVKLNKNDVIQEAAGWAKVTSPKG